MNALNPTSSRSSSAAFAVSHPGGFLRRQLWIWPLVAAVVLAFVGYWLRARMEGAMKQQIAGTLQAILNANTEALRAWSGAAKADAENLANDERVREQVAALVGRAASGRTSPAAVLNAPELDALRTHLKPWLERRGYTGFVILRPDGLVLASARDQVVGLASPPEQLDSLRPCFEGGAIVTQPFPSVALLPDAQGKLRSGVPTMFAAAPIRSADGKVIAVLGLRIAPDLDFTRILATARAGESGETYAFGKHGRQLSESRFTDQLRQLGLVPDSAEACSTLTLEVRDPLVDLTRGGVAPQRRADLPFTHSVSEALQGRSGVDVTGYRDYRGVLVVGAWTWLPEFNLGLVTEMNVSEALNPLWVLRASFWLLFGLLAISSVVIFVLMRLSNRLQAAARKAALQVKQLGQYALDDKIGAGAFGSVYRAHHALMRRPVAVKLLELEKLDNAQSNATQVRFEREVQLTSQLTHPNTIALYDYGRTPEGLFYYAMEYLDGLTLDALVKQHGPQPEARVIAILRQACGSLAEAHEIGLVHRDIKPANIFLTRRGGIPDFVKVLDFGLVKARDQENQIALTAANVTLGTPLYMSPEAVEHPELVDARSDLYSLGAVGYFLLTGGPLFHCGSIGEILMHQVKHVPEPPSQRLGKPVSPGLEALLLRCLAKDPAVRPLNARELEAALAACRGAGTWTRAEAEDWWRRLAAKAVKHAPAPDSGLAPHP